MATIRGIDEINRALVSIPQKMQQNVLRAGNRAVAKQLAEDIKAGGGAPEAITRNASLIANRKRGITKGFLVGILKPYGRLAHLFEFGSAPRYQKTTGRYTGRIIAHPFIRTALARMGADRVEQIWSKAASRNFDLQMKRLKK